MMIRRTVTRRQPTVAPYPRNGRGTIKAIYAAGAVVRASSHAYYPRAIARVMRATWVDGRNRAAVER